MPNNKTHTGVAVATGAVAAFLSAGEEAPGNQMIETLGGALGGAIGGRLPDWVDPAISPRHRGLAHAAAPTATALCLAAQHLPAVVEWLRRHAEACRAEAQKVTGLDAILRELAALIFRVLAGMVVGLAAGYASHLALDAGTMQGLPLLLGTDARLLGNPA